MGKEYYRVETDIPAPDGHKIYPFHIMKPGDSFFVQSQKPSKLRSIHHAAKRAGVKIILRPDGDGYRIWRIDGLWEDKK